MVSISADARPKGSARATTMAKNNSSFISSRIQSKEIEIKMNYNREKTYMKDFALFFDEHDKRRNTNFLTTFPEMINLYTECKDLT